MPVKQFGRVSAGSIFTKGLPITSSGIASGLRALGVVSLLGLTACAGGLNPLSGFSSTRTQGYEIPDSALQQVRAGQSMDLVITVLGSPATRNTFGDETAFYYVETKVTETSVGISAVQERTVLAVYFDEDRRVIDKAVYGLNDGRVFEIEGRRTPSFGEDRSFIESLLSSVIS